jgi:AraC-like DNA-binding protein
MHDSVHRPTPPLSDFVDNLWALGDAPRHTRERIVPSGTIELVINLREDVFRIYDADRPHDDGRRFHGAIVSGCYGESFAIDTRDHASVIGVHFRPGGAAGFLGVSPREIADTHVALGDLWGERASQLRERLCAAADHRQRFQILEEALLARMRGGDRRRRAVQASLVKLEQPRIEVGEIADEFGLSRRRFIEIFSEDVGMTPKRYARVRRFQRALARATQSESPRWAELAQKCGYFDQAHLCRDWVELTGLSPTEFLTLRRVEVKANHLAFP